MKTEFTAGPWMVLPSVVDWQYVICNTDGFRVDVAVTYGHEETPRRANANLIAAAPDLYAALTELLEIYCAVIHDAECSAVHDSDVRKFLAVLAKARGEQP